MFELIRSNKRRSVALIVGFVLILSLVGAAVGVLLGYGLQGTIIALLISGVMAFVSYWKSDAVALAVSRAKPADPEQYQRLHNLVEGLCIASGLPKPRVYIVDDPAPNAFATGRNPKHAAIAVTTGLLEKMNRVELEGVVAHELSHIRNYDILVSTLAVTLVGAVALLTNFAIRAMWWNGGRVNRSGDRNGGENPLAIVGFVLLDLRSVRRQGDAGRGEPQARDARRRLGVPDDAVPAGAHLRTGEAPRRRHGHPLGERCHRPHVDRAAHVRCRRQGEDGRVEQDVRHPPPARGADRAVEGAVTRNPGVVLLRIVSLAALAAAVIGCSSSGSTASTSTAAGDTAAPSTTSAPPETAPDTTADSTTTTVAAGPVYPLTGLPVTDPVAAQRPALVVKIDNNSAARPQSGLNEADIVFEEIVEVQTRFAAVFQSQGADPVGPIRSGRTQDIDLLGSFHHPLFTWSGGNKNVTKAIEKSDLVSLSAQKSTAYAGGGFFRSGDRKSPHNLYAQTSKLWALAPSDAAPPPQQFEYRTADEQPGGDPSTGVRGDMDGLAVGWTYDATTGLYARTSSGVAHGDALSGQVTTANVVVMSVVYRPSAADARQSGSADHRLG